jgi:hypothetical protein
MPNQVDGALMHAMSGNELSYGPERSSLSVVECTALTPANREFPAEFTLVLDPYWTHGARTRRGSSRGGEV